MEMTKLLNRLKTNPDWRAKQNLETQTEHPSAKEAKSSDFDILIMETLVNLLHFLWLMNTARVCGHWFHRWNTLK